ncbi:hypothetical protein [Agromyces aureus]|uniref:DUF7882 domain-containing protein n=1 Tax=Agromyces aureus TaxID=453304 RepID=A0A191WJI6_9MICO|nr:hypothetical protein [Agromyces aureus]ANJ28334.1 hypothetical protein ATC03_18140 [Agromyces aureus]
MGILTYRNIRAIEIEDRSLAHLRNVIHSKIRRGESFAFSWEVSVDRGSGRNSIWLGPDIPVVFEFFDSREIPLNPRWLRELNRSANSPTGLVLVPEPEAAQAPTPQE